MSTVIYDAYRLPADVQLHNVMQWVFGHREKVIELLTNEWEKRICATACEKLDRMILVAAGLAQAQPDERPSLKSNLLNESRFELEANYHKRNKEGVRSPGLDTQVRMIVFPHEDRCLAKLNCDSQQVMKYFQSIPGLEDFSYWNNTDEPEGIDQEEWNKRGEIWDDLLPNGNFELDGMVLNLSLESNVPYRPVDPSSIEGHLPNLDRRARHATHDTPVSSEIFNREGKQFSVIIAMDQGGFEEFNAMRDRVRSLLPDLQTTVALLKMDPEQRQAAIADIALRFNTPEGKPSLAGPRI